MPLSWPGNFSVSVLSSPKVHAANSNEQQVVVELFTSEGCSSCPPADKLLAELQNVDPPIIILSEHVDYWDYLGWRDPFSSPIFTRRQQLYSKVFDQKSLYTPQMVVDGTFAFVGTDGKLRA
ncbi:MAG: DUF1223 domain-containing protein [Candidatus Competibacteraceae bacterium]|nr:DUF1223 domain-containing protein [Candidatus Competibacteraceae bacterium]